MKHILPFLAITMSSPVIASDTRQLDAHEHGVGALNIAIDGQVIGMELSTPGADVVGFEYAAKTAEDRAAIETAVATLARPLDLFVLPEAAQCTVTQASAGLHSDDHEDHAHADEHEGHGHEDHADAAEHDHDDHHDEHADAHSDGHQEDDASHSEFHAEYTFNCAKPDAITRIDFAYFEKFENARELEVQIVASSGARAFEVERDAPSLDLRGMF